jgi:heat shock 70kDa protein 1/2/6/8
MNYQTNLAIENYEFSGATTIAVPAMQLLGLKWNDTAAQGIIKDFPHEIQRCGENIILKVDVNGKTYSYTPEDISTVVISALKEMAEKTLKQKVTHVVMTAPAHFDDSRRDAIKAAAAKAGLKVLRLVNEPTATGVAYEFDRVNNERNFLVVDFGGRTLDISLLSVDQGVLEILETTSVRVGGKDFNKRVAN